MSAPLVSVVIPAYNHEFTVEAAILSVLRQTYENIELVVVDDGSTDNTWPIIKIVRERAPTPFRAYTKPNGGIADALNFGIARSSGEFIAVLASDDLYLPEKIERQVALFQSSPENVGLVHSGGYEDRNGHRGLIANRYVPAEGACFKGLLAREVAALAPSIMFRRSAYHLAGGFDPELVGEDCDFYTAIAAAGFEFRYDPAPLIVKRVGSENLAHRVDLFFDDPFKTLAKYRDRVTPEEYRSIENGFYRGMGFAAASSGHLGLAWRAFSTLARRTGSRDPYRVFLSRAVRYLLLRPLPASMRLALRRISRRPSRARQSS